ncbi:hypothetical protein Dimus_036816 [Dionaea muscipula]
MEDDEIDAPAEEEEEEEEAQNADFDWEEVVDEAALQGESRSDDQFFDAQVDVEEPVAKFQLFRRFPASPGDSTTRQKEPEATESTLGSIWSHSEYVMIQLQAKFKRARENKIQADLRKLKSRMPDF